MKFETILDATIAASIATTPYWYGDLDDKKAQKHNHRRGRQCDAFRARLERMYRHADQEAGFLAELLTVFYDPLPRTTRPNITAEEVDDILGRAIDRDPLPRG